MQPFDPTLGDHVVSTHAPAGIEGEIISVRTDKGNRVNAWRCSVPAAEVDNSRYFAHGYTFETHDAFGYSILSGLDLQRVLADEYRNIGGLVPGQSPSLQRDDILIWWSGSEAVHSAIVEVPITDESSRQLNEQATIVSSVARMGEIQPAVSLAFVKSEHRGATRIEAYRKV